VPARVLIVDDHPEFRALARALLTARGFEIVGDAGSAEAALSAAARLQPDGVLLDVQLSGANGFELTRALTKRCPRAAVVLVSARDYGGCADLLRAVGAAGFVLKSRLVSEDLSLYWPDGGSPSPSPGDAA
jgi:DNA-binding NarL/FixJ family response regulator